MAWKGTEIPGFDIDDAAVTFTTFERKNWPPAPVQEKYIFLTAMRVTEL